MTAQVRRRRVHSSGKVTVSRFSVLNAAIARIGLDCLSAFPPITFVSLRYFTFFAAHLTTKSGFG